ncbi:FecR domain-containing protein [soil metagenome]
MPILPAVNAPPAAASDLFAYRVEPGETLTTLQLRGLWPPTAFLEVRRINDLSDPVVLHEGMTLQIPRRLLRVAPIRARLDSFRGAVRIGRGAPAVVGATVGQGDVITTGEDGYAALSLPDGSHIAAPSNTELRFDRLNRVVLTGDLDRVISLRRGRVESSVIPMTRPGSRYVVITPLAVSSVRGTEFRASYEPAAAAGTAGVLKGKVAVAGGGPEVLPVAGQGVTATPAGVSPPKALLPAPGLDPKSSLQSEPQIHLKLTPVAGAVRYRLLIARAAAPAAVLYEAVAPGVDFVVPELADDAYVARVSGIAADGLEGLPNDAAFARLRLSLALRPVVATTAGGRRSVAFAWDAPPGAVFRFTLTRAGQTAPVVDLPDLKASQYVATGLAPGDYSWRVFASKSAGEARLQVFSDPVPLRIAP